MLSETAGLQCLGSQDAAESTRETTHWGHERERESSGKFVGENTARDENVLNTFTAGRKICPTKYAPVASSPAMQYRLTTRG